MNIPILKTLLDGIKHFRSLHGLKRNHLKSYKRKPTLIERVETDLSNGDHKMAIRRMEGYLKHDPLDALVLDKISTIFNAYGLEARAGRYWYLQPDKKEHQMEAVKAFEESLGNDPTLILKKIITKTKFSFSRLNEQQLLILANLLTMVKEKGNITPKFLQALESHLKKRQRNRLT